MQIVESLYNVKKNAVKFYKDYFTEEGAYTSLLSDKAYLKRLYKKRMGKELNLKDPQTFTEKLNWLKLYDRKPEYTMMADKYAVREYIAEKIGEEYLVPLVGVWDSVEEIDFDSLPEKFVLKCNHDNGVIICTDKSKLDIEKTKKELQYHLSRDYYKKCREWPYKDIERKIICEEYISQPGEVSLIDYKFFCFNGKVKLLFVATGRSVDTRFDFFDSDFNHLPIFNVHKNADYNIEKPKNFKKMIEISEKLSKDIPHVRIDLYCLNGKVFFSEMTFHHFGGFHPLEPENWEYQLGDWLELPKKKRRG